jgi:hypothetical protein
MHYLLAAILIMGSMGTASAETDQAMIERYYQVRMECRQGENQERELTEAESDAACAEREALGEYLIKLGYCWYAGEQTWQRTCDDYAPLEDSTQQK